MDGTWWFEAACRGIDTELFFQPDQLRGAERRQRELAAKAVCGRCGVIDACRAYALVAREAYGVWGGLSETERSALLHREQLAG
jgi:WhiB family transcriptional regulator, redox-sensing transcriptional regulator